MTVLTQSPPLPTSATIFTRSSSARRRRGRPPKKIPHQPKYRRQKRLHGKDLAFVEIAGERHYLGSFGSEDSIQAYHRLLAETASTGGLTAPPPETITVVELCMRYVNFARGYYLKGGVTTAEPANVELALKPMLQLYGRTLAADFGPKALKVVRERFVEQGDSRRYINRHIGRIKRVFKWAVAEELVPPHMYHGLQAVTGLKFGRTTARETEPVKPVPSDLIEPVKQVVSKQVAAMITLQLLTGARPGEIVIMRGVDIDTNGPVWVYSPARHKTQHHGHSRNIPLGPRAQDLLRPFLINRPVHAYMFSPIEAEADRYKALNARSLHPKTPNTVNRLARLQTSTRSFGECYDRTSYARAITRACEIAFPPAGAPRPAAD